MSNGPKLELELHKPSLLWFAPLSVLNRHQENKYPHPEWIQPITGKNTQRLCSLARAEVNDIFQYTEIRTDSTFSSGHVFLFFFSFFILKCFPLHIYLKGREREREGEKQRVHASNCFHLLGHCWDATLSRTVMGQNQEIEIQVCHRSGRDLMIETAGAGCQSLHQQAAGARSQSQALDSGAPMWNPALVSTGETPANQWILPFWKWYYFVSMGGHRGEAVDAASRRKLLGRNPGFESWLPEASQVHLPAVKLPSLTWKRGC